MYPSAPVFTYASETYSPSLMLSQILVVPYGPVTVEPGVYLPGRGGVRIEDTLVVGDGEPELLTTTPKDLLVL